MIRINTCGQDGHFLGIVETEEEWHRDPLVGLDGVHTTR